MARSLRLDVPGMPFHVVQRGVNRAPCFHGDSDRSFYLAALEKAASTYECHVHAYVLMSNHVHLLVTARRDGGISSMMQSLGRRYVRWFNERHDRTGTLWEGRFRSGPVASDRYLLTCYRYIERNPVRAGMVERAVDYAWSSAGGNALGRYDPLLTAHPLYLSLGETACSRLAAYRAMLEEPLDRQDLDNIRRHLRQNKALGSAHFQERVEACTGRSAKLRRCGRPRNSNHS